MSQVEIWPKPQNTNDIVYTPAHIAKHIIDFLEVDGLCLDPCKGEGAFLQYLPLGSDYCEISEGVDFLKCTSQYDWIIGNPPYSIFEDFLIHAFKLADNVSFLVPINKVFQRQVIMDLINEYGGIKSMIVYGAGHKIEFKIGYPVASFHFKKGYAGDTKIIMGMNQVNHLLNTN